jgi:hypothetical protein
MGRNKKLRRRIFRKLESCCKWGGLIKKIGGYEFYDEKVEAFIKRFAKEIIKNYQKELAGLRKPFFTSPMGLEVAIEIAFRHRVNSLLRVIILERILRNLSVDEYIFSLSWDPEDPDESMGCLDAARQDNASSFPELPSGFNSEPADDIEEAWVRTVFEREHLALQRKGKDGPLLYKTITFYRDGHAEGLNKKSEIGALSEFLQVSRKRARELKHRARKLLFEAISKEVPLLEERVKLTRKRVVALRFKRQSNRTLLLAYSRERITREPVTLKESIRDYSPAEIAELNAKYCGPGTASFLRPWFLVCIGPPCYSCKDGRCFRTTPQFDDAA